MTTDDDRFYVYDRTSWVGPPPPQRSLLRRFVRWLLGPKPADLGGPVTFEIRSVPDPVPEARPPIEVRADSAEEAQAKHAKLAAVYDDLAATPPVDKMGPKAQMALAATQSRRHAAQRPRATVTQLFGGRPRQVSDDVIRHTVLNDRPQRESRDFVSDLVWYAALNSFEHRHDADDSSSTASSFSAPDPEPYTGGGGMSGGAGASDYYGDSTDSGGTDFGGGDDI